MQQPSIRPIAPTDNSRVAAIIRQVMTEFICIGPGFSIEDPEVNAMYEAYQQPGAGFYVIERDGQILGCGGYARLAGNSGETCELQKMYFLQETRSFGLGADILSACLDLAQANGFRGCYLETLTHMERAQRLYRGFGFKPLSCPMGQTGHGGCDSFYFKDFSEESPS